MRAMTATSFSTLRPITAPAPPLPKSRASWARLLRQVTEVDPLCCARCGAEMKVISVITEGAVIDRLLKHVRYKAADDSDEPFDGRAPKAAWMGEGSEVHQ